MSRARVVPREGVLDRAQLQALLTITIGHMLRPGSDAASGSQGNPLKQIVLSMGFVGLLFSFNAGRCADASTFVTFLFASTLAIVALAIVPETPDARQRVADVVLSRPVTRRTLVVARAVQLVAIATLIAGAFGVSSLMALRWHFGWSVAAVAAEGVMLVAGAACTAAFWILAMGLAVRRFGPERLRRVTQTLLALFIVALALLSTGVLAMEALSGPTTRRLAFGAVSWLDALPSTWFARAVPGAGPLAAAERVAVLLTIVGAGVVLARAGITAGQEETPLDTAQLPRPPASVRVLHALSTWPGSRFVVSRPAAAVASVILIATAREDVSRIKALVPAVLSLVFFAVGTRGEPATLLAVSVLAYFTFSSAIEGLEVTRQSSDAAASWVFTQAPLAGREILSGVRLALFARFMFLPLMLLATLMILRHPLPVALVTIAVDFALARLLVAIAMVARPAMPLSRLPSAASFATFVVSLVLGTVVVTAHALVIAIATLLGSIGVVLAAVAALATGAASVLADRWAAARLTSLETSA